MNIITYGFSETEESQGKFVQLSWGGAEYLLFAPRSLYAYHMQILNRFLADHQIPCKQLSPERILIKDSSLHVVGGGRFHAEPASRRLTLWDNSQAFGRFEAFGLVQRLAESFHPWHEFEVNIA